MGNAASLLSLPTLLTSLPSVQLDNLDLNSLTKTMEEKLDALPKLVNGISEVKDSVDKMYELSTVLSGAVELSRDAPEQLSSISAMEWAINMRKELEEPAYVFPSVFHHLHLISSISSLEMPERDFVGEGSIRIHFWDEWSNDMENLIIAVKLVDCSMSLRN